MAELYLVEVASKFDVTNKKVLRKANELLKLIGTNKSLSCSESCKAVVCLELASSFAGVGIVDRQNAVKYSGCKKSVYVNMFNIISKMLDLDKVYSVKELCLLLGVSEMESEASSLLEKYKNSKTLTDKELQHPMYLCAAIMAACRCNKIKVNVSKFVEFSRLKKKELEELAQAMQELNSSVKRPLRQTKQPSEVEPVSGNVIEKETPKKRKNKTEDEIENAYQEWKKRMLAE